MQRRSDRPSLQFNGGRRRLRRIVWEGESTTADALIALREPDDGERDNGGGADWLRGTLANSILPRNRS